MSTLSTSGPSIDRMPAGGMPTAHRLMQHALAAVDAAIVAAGESPEAAAGPPGTWAYNPLVIVGPAGAGKSRLLAEWFLRSSRKTTDRGPSATLMWDGRSLGRDLTAALSQDTIDRLHERFVAARLVIIDGVEQITAWDAQRTLAHLFDAATAAGTRFVATVRMHPIACTGLDPTLASRLSGGLVVAMPPAGSLRCRLDGAAGSRPISLRRVINAASRYAGLQAADLVGPSRRRHVSQARGIAMYLARRLSTKSLQAIGAAFGGRDHTTVLHGIRVTERRRSVDAGLAADIDRLAAALVAR